MCSIAGFISKQPLSNYLAHRLAAALLYHGEARGRQSAGVFVHGEENVMVKKAVSPFAFINSDEFRNIWLKKDMKTTLVLCHTRQPTSGGLGDAQAHPFWVGNTVAVHNGGVYNVKELREKYELTKDSGVDSEIICSAMDKFGPKGLAPVISDMSGSASVAMFYENELYVGCDGNPLEYFTFSLGEDNAVTVFASTSHMIQQALHHVWLFENQHMKTESLPKMQLFKMDAAGTLTGVSKFSTKSYSCGRNYSRGGSSTDYEGYGEGYSWRGQSGGQSRPQPPTATAIITVPTTTTNAPNTSQQLNNELKNISHPQGSPGIGYFRVCTISRRRGWMYSRTYAEKQMKKFPNLLQSGGGGKGKKDRNRNGTSAKN